MDKSSTLTQLETSSDHIVFNAEFPGQSASTLFAYFTQPALLTRWWPPEAVVEGQIGGTYRFSWPTMKWHLFGHFTHFEPDHHLGYTWQWEHQLDLPTRHVDIVFVESEGGCKTTLTHGTYGDLPTDMEDRQNHIDGWSHFLAQLQILLVV